MARRSSKSSFLNVTPLPPKEDILGEIVEAAKEEAPITIEKTPIYSVHVTHPSLRRRAEPSYNAKIMGFITDCGIYKIFAENAGWGQLEDETWIALQYTSKIK